MFLISSIGISADTETLLEINVLYKKLKRLISSLFWDFLIVYII